MAERDTGREFYHLLLLMSGNHVTEWFRLRSSTRVQHWTPASSEVKMASGMDGMNVRQRKGTLSSQGSRHGLHWEERVTDRLNSFRSKHRAGDLLQTSQVMIGLQKQNCQRLPIQIIQDHIFCPI